jgi:shikimate 5-dehydrogenase
VVRRFLFIGVTTSQSSMMRIFPRWRDALQLGSDVELVGCDLPLHAYREMYRDVVGAIKEEPTNLGALVTTHKIDLYRAAHDLFDEVDGYAQLLEEVSCIAKRDGRLLGWAKDPLAAGRAIEAILRSGYFGRTGGNVLCFGAGGAGNAIVLHLLTRPERGDRPARIVVTDRDAGRLDHAKQLHRKARRGMDLPSELTVEYVQSLDPRRNDELVAGLPPGSLVINATGMGKDRPGSPVTDTVQFPEEGIAWELNYRYEPFPDSPYFLHQAARQRESRKVRVEDGWHYFILGWTSVMEEVFDRRIPEDELEMLSREAAFARPPASALLGEP